MGFNEYVYDDTIVSSNNNIQSHYRKRLWEAIFDSKIYDVFEEITSYYADYSIYKSCAGAPSTRS